MFFFFSKLLYFLISPLNWIIAALFFSLFKKDSKKKKRFLIIAITLSLFFSNEFIFNVFINQWEYKATPIDSVKTYDYGILLGGMITFDDQINRINSQRSIDRLIQTILLYKKHHIKKIFISGGSGSVTNPDMLEAKYLKNYLINIGIPENDILIETKSRNTHENAVYTAEALGDTIIKNSSFLLITSATHLPRATKCYHKVGIYAMPFATDRYGGPYKLLFDYFLIPNAETLSNWNVLIKEYVGVIAYYFAGYI